MAHNAGMPSPTAAVRERWVSSLVFASLLSLAFANGLATTRDLTWPGAAQYGVGIDLYRDMAFAQTMLDSGFGPDPNYPGERMWYTPLVPAITAATSALTGAAPSLVVTRLGAYANLIAPLAFYVLAATLFGRWLALYAVAGFLFLMGSALPSWISATYSPWLMPVNFAQGLFYLTVWALVRARRSSGLGWYTATGTVWGLTLLAHVAPALIFGVMAVTALAFDVRWGPAPRVAAGTALGRFALMTTLALVVSSPLLVSIVGHYGLRTQHPQPAMYTEPLLGRELPRLLWLHLTAPLVVAAVGALALARRKASTARLVVGTWLAAAGLFLVQAYVVLAARLLAGWTLPSVVPSFHFFFYAKGATALLFALGVAAIAARAARLAMFSRWSPRVLADGLCVSLLVLGAPTYFARPDFGEARRDALATMASSQVRVAEWLRERRHPSDVVVTSDYDAAVIAGPAGVKVVAAFSTFSNPYVDWDARDAARNRLFAALDAGDDAAFADLADRFALTHVIARGRRGNDYASRPLGPIKEIFAAGDIRVFRRR